ncbi:MAG: tetratricopeptide repeat protein [Pontibacterium sp.]
MLNGRRDSTSLYQAMLGAWLVLACALTTITSVAAVEQDLKALESVVAEQPNNLAYRLILGKRYLALGELEKAKAQYQQVITQAPQNSRAQLALEQIQATQSRASWLASLGVSNPFNRQTLTAAILKNAEQPEVLDPLLDFAFEHQFTVGEDAFGLYVDSLLRRNQAAAVLAFLNTLDVSVGKQFTLQRGRPVLS